MFKLVDVSQSEVETSTQECSSVCEQPEQLAHNPNRQFSLPITGQYDLGVLIKSNSVFSLGAIHFLINAI